MNNMIVKIGQVIKEKRLLKGYSTQELSELLDVSTGLINNIENGKTDTFNLAFMERLCSALDISILSILVNETKEIKELLNVTRDVSDRLSNDLNNIIDLYLQLAIKLNYDSDKLQRLKEKVIYELNFISSIV